MTQRFGMIVLGALLGAGLTLGAQAVLPDRGGPYETPTLLEGAEADAARAQQIATAEDRVRTDLQLALQGFFRTVEFRDFALLGRESTVFVPVSGQPNRGELLAGAATSGSRLPRIVIDPDARGRWTELGSRLETLEESVDPRVFEAFESVRAYAREHPLPASTDLRAAARSEWATAAVVERWEVLNATLASRAIAVLSQLDGS